MFAAATMVLMAVGVPASSADSKWEGFKIEYNKVFKNTSEEIKRKAIFLSNLGHAGEIANPSKYADLTAAEFLLKCEDDSKQTPPITITTGSYDVAVIEKLLPLTLDVDVTNWQFAHNGTIPCDSSEHTQQVFAPVRVIASTSTHWVVESKLFQEKVRISKSEKCFRESVPDTTPPPARRFFQRQCDDELCQDHCATMPFLMDTCLQTEGGGSLVAVECNAGVGLAVIQYLATNDCTGFAVHTSQPIDSCQPNSVPGSYFVNFCTKPDSPNVTISTPAALRTVSRGL
eukprot:TRINITY_DN12692_c1_g1_i1.p1 TRINITY_DN12692_c1_g1~~TRINITY_DN12692_c1_g1_i1.p1  ORF type:complete len:287 (+),score=53.69 TRINITY_DN12692_c1_g1_i1:114-974(+)